MLVETVDLQRWVLAADPGGSAWIHPTTGSPCALPNSALVSACVESSATTASAHRPVLERSGAPDPVTLSAAAVFSLLPVLRARRQAQQAYRDSPVPYLLRLGEELRPQTMTARAGHRVRRFVTGI